MDPGPQELEKRYRRFLEGKGDAVGPLLCYLGGGGDARAVSGAWAAAIVSRIFLLKGNIPLARAYLRIAAARSSATGRMDLRGRTASATLRLGILVNRAIILKASGNAGAAAALLRAIVDRALREGETFVAAKAASNLALCMARSGEAADASSYLGLAERGYRAVGCEIGLIRLEMTRALVETARGSMDAAVENICAALRECGEARFARERAIGLLLLAELFLEKGDPAAAREALDRARSMKDELERFGPQRLILRRLQGELERRSGTAHVSRSDAGPDAASIAREAAGEAVQDVRCAARAARHRGEATERPDDAFVTCDPRMAELLRGIERASHLPVPLLIEGESGTGKDLVARLVHEWSGRGREPFVPVNAAAIPADLFESMAFGHARGAFTGAIDARAGFAAAAGRGTLFLDEVGELSPAAQTKLLRLIDRREYIPLGETRPRAFEARLVAATNRDLKADCESGRFRADLYYRLSPLAFRLPPLRERPADIARLARHFAGRLPAGNGIGPTTLHEGALAALVRHAWPGNARELEGEILRAALAAKGGSIRACHLSAAIVLGPDGAAPPPSADLAARLTALERECILEALRDSGESRTIAARRLGMKRTTLLSAMRRLGIE